MLPVSSSANTILSTLIAQQAAIGITSDNIANVNTEGYTLKQVVIQSSTSGTTAGSKRVYDVFLSRQLNMEKQKLGEYDAAAKYLDSIEVLFNEAGGSGLSSAMSAFWSGWQALAGNPSSPSARAILVSDAQTMARTFNNTSSELSKVQENIDGDIVDNISAINEDIRQIADLNRRIAQVGAGGQDTGAYQDSLDALVSDLSTLVDVKTYTTDSGQICIQLADGKPLVTGVTPWSLSTTTSATTGLQDVTWVDGSGNATVITSDITSGKLGGCLAVRDDFVPSYQDKLDTLAASIMAAVNGLQTSGYDLDGNAGTAFFTGAGAKDMAVNAGIVQDANKIATSSAAGKPTDGSIAVSISNLEDNLALNAGTSTFSDYYNALVSKVGADVSIANSNRTSQATVVSACKNLRDSVSSVSLDEEQIKLLMYQRAYEAAAKVMGVLDELLKTLINM